MKDEGPLHYANEDFKKKLEDITNLFAQYVAQEAQSIKEDVRRIENVIHSSNMGA